MRVLDWVRELMGWCLVFVGLWVAWQGLTYVEERKVIEGGVVLVASLGLVRSGILLIRLTTATRVAKDWDTPTS